MSKKADKKESRERLGRLDVNAPMPLIRPGDKVTVRVVNRREPERKQSPVLGVPKT